MMMYFASVVSLKAVFQQDIQEEINGDFNGSQIKALREKGLKMRNIVSIFYCELDEIRKQRDDLELVPGGPVSGYNAVYWSQPSDLHLTGRRVLGERGQIGILTLGSWILS